MDNNHDHESTSDSEETPEFNIDELDLNWSGDDFAFADDDGREIPYEEEDYAQVLPETVEFTVDDNNYNHPETFPSNITTLIWKANASFRFYTQFDNIIEFTMMTNYSVRNLFCCEDLLLVELLGDYNINEKFSEPLQNVNTVSIGESYTEDLDILSNFPNVQILKLEFYSTLYNPLQTLDVLSTLEKLVVILLKRGSISRDELSRLVNAKNIDYQVEEEYSVLSDLVQPNTMLLDARGIYHMATELQEFKDSEASIPDVYYATPLTNENVSAIRTLDRLISLRGGWTYKEINEMIDTEFTLQPIGDPGNKSYYKDHIPYLTDPSYIRDTDLKYIISTYNFLRETSNEIFLEGNEHREYDRVMYMIWNFRNGITRNVDMLDYRITLKNELSNLLETYTSYLYEFTRTELTKTLKNINRYKEDINLCYTDARSKQMDEDITDPDKYDEFIEACSAYTTYINVLEITQNEYNTWIPVYKIRKERTALCARELVLLENEIKEIQRIRQEKRTVTIRPMSKPVTQRSGIIIRRGNI
jgi:hypothetical protein